MPELLLYKVMVTTQWDKAMVLPGDVPMWIAHATFQGDAIISYFGHHALENAPVIPFAEYEFMGRETTTSDDYSVGKRRFNIEKNKKGGVLLFRQISKAAVSRQPTLDNSDPLYIAIRERLHKKNREFGHGYVPDKGTQRMSSLPGCMRKMQFAKMNLKKPKTLYFDKAIVKESFDRHYRHKSLDVLNEAEAGQSVHEYIQSRLEGSDIVINMEFDIPPTALIKGRPGKVTGHPDMLCRVDNELVVIDIKSTKGFQYTPKAGHLEQLLGYQAALGGIKGAILYMDRNNYEMRYYKQDFDESWLEPLQEKLDLVFTAEEERTIIPLTAMQRGALLGNNNFWECRELYCKFRYCCETDLKEEMGRK